MTPDTTIPLQPQEIRTERLILRRWRQEDFEPFRAMNADPEVTRFFMGTFSAEQSDASADRIMNSADTARLGAWALEVPGEAPFIGFAGCWPTRQELPFAPAIEIGWRLAKPYWGRGYAPEAARAALADAFARTGANEILAYATPLNEPSLRVMHKLGMTYSPGEDFEHFMFEDGHPNQRHVVYRITAEQFRRAQAA